MKKLNYGFYFIEGRNNGLISSYHRGGGNKKQFKVIDRFRYIFSIPGKVVSICYDPIRSARLFLIVYSNGIISYVPAVAGIKVGKSVLSIEYSENYELTMVGLTCPISFVKTGLRVCSIELYPGYGASVARASGLFATIVRKFNSIALLRLASGELRMFSLECFCTIGSILESEKSKFLNKAGFNRWHGWRPVVRGRAMNPVDHPHGGRTNGGMVPTTPWARSVKGQKTSRSVALSVRFKKSRV